VAGPKDFDALAGLGLKPQLLINDGSATPASSTTPAKVTDNAAVKPATASTTTTGPQIVGLGINVGIDLLSKDTAAHANVVLQGAMSLIKQAYSQLNTPQTPAATAATGAVPAYLQNQLSGYQTALAWLQTINTTS
jgi:hypothetical protein